MFRRGHGISPARVFRSFGSAADQGGGRGAEGYPPCSGCVAPCCSTVTLHEMVPHSFRDVDYLGYLVGFDRIELIWLSRGLVEVNYRALCDHLDRRTARCRVHGSEEQPLICRSYDAEVCSYRGQFLGAGAPKAVRVSRARFPSVAARFRFDRRGGVVESPSVEAVAEAVESCLDPPRNGRPGAPAEDVLAEEMRPYRRPRPLPRTAGADGGGDRSLGRLELAADPCGGCSAPCCRVLLFPLPEPEGREQVSFFRYLTRFPGLELAVTPRGWVLQCFSSCRHLAAPGRCGIFGRVERPVYCRSYDPWSCRYAPTYVEGDALFQRLDPEGWRRVEERFRFAADDSVAEAPDFAAARVLARGEGPGMLGAHAGVEVPNSPQLGRVSQERGAPARARD